MSYVTYKIYRTPFLKGGHDIINREEITDWYTPEIVTNIGDGKDQFSFKVNNKNNIYDGKFNPRDKITIYRGYNTTVLTDDNILMVGLITDAPEKITFNQDYLRVKGYNHSETLLNALVFMDPMKSGKTIPEAIQEGLLRVSTNESFKVTWHPDNKVVKENGDPFPVLNERIFYKPMIYVMEKYSSQQYTTDGTYMWYVDNENRLVWKKEKDAENYYFSSVDTATLTADTDFVSIDIGKNTKDVRNYAIVKGGYDPYGRGVTGRYVDYVSATKHGLRFQYVTDGINYIGDLNEEDITKLEVIHSTKAEGKLPSTVSGFSYPHQFDWMTEQDPAITAATDDADYVQKLRDYIRKVILTDVGKVVIDSLSSGRLSVKLSVKAGTKLWGLGDVIRCYIPNTTIGSSTTSEKNLRIQEITYGQSLDNYTLAEDTTKGTI